jgi:hypothetical protein
MIKKVWLGWEKENEYYSLNMRGDAAMKRYIIKNIDNYPNYC